jgi:hypothetical protein
VVVRLSPRRTSKRSGDGSSAARELIAGDTSENTPRFVQDGRQVAFISSRDGAAQVYIADATGGIHLAWQVTYTREGLPPFVLRGEEWDLFPAGKLAMHYERIHNGEEALAYMARHHEALLPAREPGAPRR